jgi:hypothetical protein
MSKATMKATTEPTFTVRLYMAGDIDDARRYLRRWCYPPNEGYRFSIESSTFIYTGGEESGFAINFVNYPRFPETPEQIKAKAIDVAKGLLRECCQWTALLVTPAETIWITAKPE